MCTEEYRSYTYKVIVNFSAVIQWLMYLLHVFFHLRKLVDQSWGGVSQSNIQKKIKVTVVQNTKSITHNSLDKSFSWHRL